MGIDYKTNTAEMAREFTIVNKNVFQTKNRKREVIIIAMSLISGKIM